MLNRNNLTLSATSNRLNLGTRSLVLNTSVNDGKATRVRHDHHDFTRVAMAVFGVCESFAPPASSITDPAISYSPADASPRPSQARGSWRLRQDSQAGSCSSPSSRSRAAAAASATGPRLGRGLGKAMKAIGKLGAAGAADSRTANGVAFATIAGS